MAAPPLNVQFIKSSSTWQECPPLALPEVALIGRSNVGKSSLINTLAGNKNLAKVSSTPGKTRLINHFLVNERWYLVDLPGYGFAKLPKPQRARLQEMIEGYILARENLYCLFLLLDSRHEPLKNDLDFLQWVGENQVPVALVFTKADKVSQRQRERHLEEYQQALSAQWEELPPHFHTSSLNGMGREELLHYIESFVGE